MLLHCLCHVTPLSVSCYSTVCAMLLHCLCHVTPLSVLCYSTVCAMLLHCLCHVTPLSVMLLHCLCHVTPLSVPCYSTVCAMLLHCLCHVTPLSVSCYSTICAVSTRLMSRAAWTLRCIRTGCFTWQEFMRKSVPQLEKMLEEARSHNANTKAIEKWLLSKCCASGVSHWSLICGGQ